jgi:hypothetical protein
MKSSKLAVGRLTLRYENRGLDQGEPVFAHHG